MHAGLNRPDCILDPGGMEARQVAGELKAMPELGPCKRAKVALVFSYEADWVTKIQPHGRGFRALNLAFETYSALRRAGLDIDMVAPDGDFAGYALVVAPTLPTLSDETVANLKSIGAVVLMGPRSGSRTRDMHIPPTLAPGPLQAVLPIKVSRVESLRPGAGPVVRVSGQTFTAKAWREVLETDLAPIATFEDGQPAWVAKDGWHYLATWPDAALFDAVIARVAGEARLEVRSHVEGVRTRDRDGVRFAINFALETRETPAPSGTPFLLGGPELEAGEVAAWRF